MPANLTPAQLEAVRKHNAEQWMQAYDGLPPKLRAYVAEHDGPTPIMWMLLHRHRWSEDEIIAWAKHPTPIPAPPLLVSYSSSTSITTPVTINFIRY